jgi:hypothetical protein
LDPDRYDLENPYAPPDSSFVPESPQGEFGSIAFTVGDLWNWTWSLYKERFGICLKIILGVGGLNLMLSIVSQILLNTVETAVRDPIIFAVSQIGIIFCTYVLSFWLSVGSNLAFLKIARREDVVFGDVFTGAPYVLTTILATLLFTLLVGGPMLLGFLGGAAMFPMIQDNQSVLLAALFLISFALLVIVSAYIGIRLLQFYFVVIDQNAGVIECMRTSWHLTKNQVPTLILVYLLQMTIMLAGLLACCVGLIFATPLATLLLAVTYQSLTGQWVPEVRFVDSWQQDRRERAG